MASLSIETPEHKSHRPLAFLAVAVALGAPAIQTAMRPLFEVIPYPLNRFVSLGLFWIAVAFAIFVSVRIEGIPLATFGITKNTRSLGYRLIEMIGALLIALAIAIVLILFSEWVRGLLGVPSTRTFDPNTILPAWVMIPAWITAAFAEEFLFRAYPIERLTMLTGKRWLAAIVSCLAFSFLHWPAWDIIQVLSYVLPAGIIITGIYLWRKSLWFVILIHATVNLPVLILPLIAPFLK